MAKINFTKRNIRKMFLRVLEDCDKCTDKESVKNNIIQETKWFGFKIK